MALFQHQQQPAKLPQDTDVVFQGPPTDSISCLAVNGSDNNPTTVVVASSWDNTVSCYEVQYSNVMNQPPQISGAVQRGQLTHEGSPVLACDLSLTDGVTSFSAGCDGKLRMWNVTQPGTSAQVVGQHDNAIKTVKCIQVGNNNLVVTGSWDKTVRVWDCRSPSPALSQQLSERVYCLDARGSAMVVGTADKGLHVYDFTNGLNRIAAYMSPLHKFQTKSVAIFADIKGFAVGTVEGRVALEYFSEMSKKDNQNPDKKLEPNFSYKCHRDKRQDNGSHVYAVNDIHFNRNNTFCTAGSDGVLNFWCKETKHKLKGLEKFKGRCPFTAARYAPMGNAIFYAASYDWSKGAEGNNPQMGVAIYGHMMAEAELRQIK